MVTSEHVRLGQKARWIALTIIAMFIGLQSFTANYGTTINNIPHIAEYEVAQQIDSRSSLERATVVGESLDRESLDLWMTRYKLYSINADEMVSIMALARIKQDWRKLDPGFYQYGGAWLYPLGAWYYGLSKIGVLSLGSLDSFLAEPDRMDAVYYWGRLFVILTVAAAAYMLFLTLSSISSPSVSLAGLVIFLFTPSTIIYSQIMKPHWYALMWASAAIFLIVRTAKENDWTPRDEVFLGVTVGLTFASVNTFAPFTILIWCALALMTRKQLVPFRALTTVPTIAILFWVITNPHIFLHWDSFRHSANMTSAWFNPQLSWESITGFLWNSGWRGFGFAFLTGVIMLALAQIVKPQIPAARWLAFGVLGVILFISWITASMVSWGINSRYSSYLLLGGLVLLSLVRWRAWPSVMWGVAILTTLQSVPLVVAYVDEDSSVFSTRLQMAHWVDSNVAEGSSLCLGTRTPAPYDVPPFHFDHYRINHDGCPKWVIVERESVGSPPPEGWEVAQRMMPRYSPSSFRLVFGHINPQITVYQRKEVE